MDSQEIFQWLRKQEYQTDFDETGEYRMYFGVDMPKILNDFLEYINAADESERSHP